MQIEPAAGRAPTRAIITASIALLIVVWAVNFIAGKIALRSFPALALASFRVVLAGIVMIPAYFLCSRLTAFAETAEARRKGFTLHDFWTFLYLGFFGVTVNQMCFTIGLHYTSVSHASVIVGMGPIYTLVLAALLRLETATWRKAAGMAIALAGIVVMASEKGLSAHSPSLLGDAIVMTGSIGFAMCVVLGKRVAGKYDTLTMTAFNHFAGALIVLPLTLRQTRVMSHAEKWQATPDPAGRPRSIWRSSAPLPLASRNFQCFPMRCQRIYRRSGGGESPSAKCPVALLTKLHWPPPCISGHMDRSRQRSNNSPQELQRAFPSIIAPSVDVSRWC